GYCSVRVSQSLERHDGDSAGGRACRGRRAISRPTRVDDRQAPGIDASSAEKCNAHEGQRALWSSLAHDSTREILCFEISFRRSSKSWGEPQVRSATVYVVSAYLGLYRLRHHMTSWGRRTEISHDPCKEGARHRFQPCRSRSRRYR